MNNCLTLPAPSLREDLSGYATALRSVLRLKPAHQRELHYAVADLSRALTTERGGMKVNYWSTPRNASAYLHFYLPWNLYRLAWLLPSLQLDLRDGDTILDLGSGPLTLVQALWLTRPELRDRKLTFICSDIAPKPLDTGRLLLEALMGQKSSQSNWNIMLERAPLEKALRNNFGKARLVCGANMLNELRAGRGQTLEDRMEELALAMTDACTDDGEILFVEPGTRLGGKMISLLRLGLLDHDMFPYAPCTHDAMCPMLDQGSTGWCHFNAPADNAPAWLMELTNRARMDRKNVSLSFMHAGRTKPAYDRDEVRVLSDPIRLPEKVDTARYACSERGLTLLHKALRFPSGAAVEVDWPETPVVDAKSRAQEVSPRKR